MDRAIIFEEAGPDGLRAKFDRFRPRVLCFNGKRAAKAYYRRAEACYGFQQEIIGATRIFVAPSTSGVAAASWDPSIWKDLADFSRGNQAAA
ncbi:MAG: hypothetical protein KGZ35_05020 [Truepera sp.]|nr:hypothetical protein [Truepera sp.]